MEKGVKVLVASLTAIVATLEIVTNIALFGKYVLTDPLLFATALVIFFVFFLSALKALNNESGFRYGRW